MPSSSTMKQQQRQQRKLEHVDVQYNRKYDSMNNKPAWLNMTNARSPKSQKPQTLQTLQKPQTLQAPQKPQQQQQMMSTAPIAKRVYILGHTGDERTVAIKEVQYLVPGAADKTPSGTRPAWVPGHIETNNWSLQPPCFWSTQIVSLAEIESSGGKLLYNPYYDYSLELIRLYQPEMFNALFRVFCLVNKKLYSNRQLDEFKSLLQAQNLPLSDFDLNFSPQSPVAAILNSPKAGTELLVEIEHYLVLLRIRAHAMRGHLAYGK